LWKIIFSLFQWEETAVCIARNTSLNPAMRTNLKLPVNKILQQRHLPTQKTIIAGRVTSVFSFRQKLMRHRLVAHQVGSSSLKESPFDGDESTCNNGSV
jgi:hypothetical protein